MVVSLEAIIPSAYVHHYAIGAFNVCNIETVQAVLNAAEELQAPVIVQTSEKALDYAGFDTLIEVVLAMAKRSQVPVVVHLDHGRSMAVAKRCLERGYTSVMVDFSHLSFVENVSQTAAVVKIAHRLGAAVEGELGTVLGEEDDTEASKLTKTDPELALQFIEQTGVDLLAVGIGNAHGRSIVPEKLDFSLLQQIYQTTNHPLVLHGASGDGPADIHQAIQYGVVKINIDTDLRLAFVQSIRSFLRTNPEAYDIRQILSKGREAMTSTVKQKINLFGSQGKA